MTTVLPVGSYAFAVAGVFCWVWVAAVGLWAAACLVVVGPTGGYAAGAAGAH